MTTTNTETLRTIDLGNNEIRSIGVSGIDADGYYTALTLSQSKRFRTRVGAEKWLACRGYAPNGQKL